MCLLFSLHADIEDFLRNLSGKTNSFFILNTMKKYGILDTTDIKTLASTDELALPLTNN